LDLVGVLLGDFAADSFFVSSLDIFEFLSNCNSLILKLDADSLVRTGLFFRLFDFFWGATFLEVSAGVGSGTGELETSSSTNGFYPAFLVVFLEMVESSLVSVGCCGSSLI